MMGERVTTGSTIRMDGRCLSFLRTHTLSILCWPGRRRSKSSWILRAACIGRLVNNPMRTSRWWQAATTSFFDSGLPFRRCHSYYVRPKENSASDPARRSQQSIEALGVPRLTQEASRGVEGWVSFADVFYSILYSWILNILGRLRLEAYRPSRYDCPDQQSGLEHPISRHDSFIYTRALP